MYNLDMAGNGWKWMEWLTINENCWNGRNWLDIVINGWKQMEKNGENGLAGLETAVNCQN